MPDGRCDEGGLNREPVLEVSSQQLRTGLLLAVIANLIWGLAALFWSETALVSPVDVVAHRAVWSLPVALLALLWAGATEDNAVTAEGPKNPCVECSGDAITRPQLGRFRLRGLCRPSDRRQSGIFHAAPPHGARWQACFRRDLGRSSEDCDLSGDFGCCHSADCSRQFAVDFAGRIDSAFALYGAIRKKIEADTLQGLFIEMLCMAPFALTWLWMTDGAGLGQHGLRVDIFLLLGGIYTTAPLLTYIAATRLLPLKIVGLTSYLGPSLQLLVAQTLLGETIDAVTAASFGLVWVGVLLASGQGLLKLQRRPLRGR